MLAPLFPVQPTATRSRLAPGSESRCGSSQLVYFQNFFRARWLILLALLLFARPATPAALEGAGRSGEFIYNLACFTLALDANPLWAGDESLEAIREDREHPHGAISLLTERKVSMRGNRRDPKVDWTGHWMFTLGLVLFWVSWLLAAWERGSRVYVRPLLPDEPVPAPKPPGILFTLK